MKKCKYCQSEIDDKAKVCPVCKRTQKGHGCLMIIAIFIVLSFGSFIMMSMSDSAIQKNVSGVSNSSEYITMKEFNSIKSGMTYEQVAKIIGSPGEITSQVESGGYKITMVTWYGNGTAGSNANVTFENGKATAKAQFGLK